MTYNSKSIEELVEELNAQNPRYYRLPGNPVVLPGNPVVLPGIPIKLPGIPIKLPGTPINSQGMSLNTARSSSDENDNINDDISRRYGPYDESINDYSKYPIPNNPWHDPSVPPEVLMSYKQAWTIYHLAKWVYTFASKHLLHYLTGSGNALQYAKEQLRHNLQVLEAEVENRKRFETTTMKKKVIPKIKEKNFTVYDWWEVQKTAPPMSDWYFAFGTFTIVSYGIFNVKYSNGICTVKGNIAHYFWDIYDWHEGLGARLGVIDVTDAEMASLQRYCGAKKFREYGIWQQTMEGTYDVKNNKGDFYWYYPESGGWDIKDKVEANIPKSIRPPANEMHGVKN